MWIEIGTVKHFNPVRCVTPFTGVWIEIISVFVIFNICFVTPFTGVWIEIYRFGRDG